LAHRLLIRRLAEILARQEASPEDFGTAEVLDFFHQ
jgi:hypothetical protein